MAQKSDTLLNFKVFLIDSTDIKLNPILIGETNADTSGVIEINIPDSINTKKTYHLWILCSDTTITYHYPELIKISKAPEGTITGSNQPCLNNPSEYSINLDNENYSYYWTCNKGTVVNNGTNNADIIIDSLGIVNIEVIVRDEQTGCEQKIIKQVEVINTTEITFTENPQICWDAEPYLLTEGRPEGGKYVSEYVKDNYFDAKLSGSGIFNVKYIYTDTNGCVSENSYPVQIFEKPIRPTITRQKNDLISSYETGNQWYFNDTIIQGAIGKVLPLTKTGYYSVQITDSNQCSSERSEIYSFEAGVEDIHSEISIRPNPANDYIEIWGYQSDIRIYDVLGIEVYCSIATPPAPSLEGGKTRFDVSHLSPGVYFVRVGNIVRKFVKI
jgi:hypothetical protein